MGTTEDQLEEAARVAAETAMYSAYIHAQSTDLDDFQHMTDEIAEHSGSRGGQSAELQGEPRGHPGAAAHTFRALRRRRAGRAAITGPPAPHLR